MGPSRLRVAPPSWILIFGHIQLTLSAKFAVLGPDLPIIATFGADAILRCSLYPAVSAEHMEIRWFRHSFHSPVHLYRGGKDENDQQLPEYQGRTELIRDGIHNGSVGLKISKVRISDEGQYKCFFEENVFYEEAILELKVAGYGSPPHIHLVQHQDGGIRAVCQSVGWYPEPDVIWRSDDEQNISSASKSQTKENSGLYKVENVIIIMQPAGRQLDCSIQTSLMNQAEVATISIADPFFPKISPWAAAFFVMFGGLVSSVAVAGWYVWKQHKDKGTLCLRLAELSAEVDFRKAAMKPVRLELDERTANPNLTVSDQRKRVGRGQAPRDAPDDLERFDTESCVLGIQRFTLGKHYWKVDVGDGPEWAVGLCRDSVRRNGAYQFSPEEGIWCVALFVDQYRALSSPEVILPLVDRPRWIGVYLDYEAGKLKFYNAESMDPIYTYPVVFEGTVRPFFWIGNTGSEIVMCH